MIVGLQERQDYFGAGFLTVDSLLAESRN